MLLQNLEERFIVGFDLGNDSLDVPLTLEISDQALDILGTVASPSRGWDYLVANLEGAILLMPGDYLADLLP